jgi:hypothetical protein
MYSCSPTLGCCIALCDCFTGLGGSRQGKGCHLGVAEPMRSRGMPYGSCLYSPIQRLCHPGTIIEPQPTARIATLRISGFLLFHRVNGRYQSKTTARFNAIGETPQDAGRSARQRDPGASWGGGGGPPPPGGAGGGRGIAPSRPSLVTRLCSSESSAISLHSRSRSASEAASRQLSPLLSTHSRPVAAHRSFGVGFAASIVVAQH